MVAPTEERYKDCSVIKVFSTFVIDLIHDSSANLNVLLIYLAFFAFISWFLVEKGGLGVGTEDLP